jgi:hypothetical protein
VEADGEGRAAAGDDAAVLDRRGREVARESLYAEEEDEEDLEDDDG